MEGTPLSICLMSCIRHKFIIKVLSLLSRCFYPSFLQNPGTLLHPSDCPKTQAPLQQIIGPLAHEGFYGVEGHLKPELEQTLNNEHLISI